MSAANDWNSLSLEQLWAEVERSGLPRRLLELARDEDLGWGAPSVRGDLTTASWVGDARGEASTEALLVAREEGIAAGLAALPMLIEVFGCRVDVQAMVRDGSRFAAGQLLARISGPLGDILRLERTLLNLASRLSGIATMTAAYVEAMGAGARAGLYDTRKTTPGLRVLEKYAVRCGGGRSHRFGLWDAVLVKDNHIAGVEGGELTERLIAASARARGRQEGRPGCFVEIEADSIEQVGLFLAAPEGTIDAVLLDNMMVDELRRAVAMRDGMRPRVQLEASGGITLATIGEVARSGVDRISVGAITHGARSLDLGLDIGPAAARKA